MLPTAAGTSHSVSRWRTGLGASPHGKPYHPEHGAADKPRKHHEHWSRAAGRDVSRPAGPLAPWARSVSASRLTRRRRPSSSQPSPSWRRLGALGLVGRQHLLCDDRHRTARLLDGGLRRRRDVVRLDLECRLQVAIAQDAQTVEFPTTTPAATSALTSISPLPSSAPASTACCRRPRLTSFQCFGLSLLKPRLEDGDGAASGRLRSRRWRRPNVRSGPCHHATHLAHARSDTAADADADLRAPGLSLTLFSRRGQSFLRPKPRLLLLVDDADEMRDLVDHAAHAGVSSSVRVRCSLLSRGRSTSASGSGAAVWRSPPA